MTLTIELPAELDDRLRKQAKAVGRPAEQFVVEALVEKLSGQEAGLPATLAPEESRLIEEINRGPAESTWRRYRALVQSRRDNTLTAEEQAELLTLTDEIELDHARRLESVARLARIRSVSVVSLMQQLGMRIPGDE